MLRTLFPEVEWLPWKFKRLSMESLDDDAVFEKIIKVLENEFNIKNPEEWNRVSENKLRKLKVKSYFDRRGGLKAVLRKRFPTFSFPE